MEKNFVNPLFLAVYEIDFEPVSDCSPLLRDLEYRVALEKAFRGKPKSQKT